VVADRPRAASPWGFSFIEVLLAMSILLVGGIAVLSLFAVGVSHLVQRRVDAGLDQVRPEVTGLAQSAVDKRPPGELPEAIPPKPDDPPRPLSLPGFGVRVRFERNPFGGPGVYAHSVLYHQGRVVKVLPPLPLVRTTIDPK
jgi:hypothetical protein